MHKDTIDWYRQLNLTSDATLAAKRWDTANKVAEKLTRTRIVELLRLYLFPQVNSDFAQKFTSELKDFDIEFPGDENTPELRLMAGLVAVTTFGAPSHVATAFALGIRAASFPRDRVQPIEPAIIAESEKYLRTETNRLHSDDFATDGSDLKKGLNARLKAIADAVATGDAAKIVATEEAYRKSVIGAISESNARISGHLQQLAEESSMLWWVVSEFSDAFQKPVTDLAAQEYALAAASEAAQRTRLLPPPPCIGPLIDRALKPCKPGKKQPVFADYLEATKPDWRATQVKLLSVADCRDLVPFCVALEKTEELGEAASALKVLSKLCPGVSGEMPLPPTDAAQQFYAELIFLRALAETSTD